MDYQTSKLNESEERKVKLDNEEISVNDFNRKLESLNKNQRIVESSKDSFFIVEKMYD